jgi:hypothetical protein
MSRGGHALPRGFGRGANLRLSATSSRIADGHAVSATISSGKTSTSPPDASFVCSV